MNIEGPFSIESIRTVLDFPIPGIQFRDITGLLEDPKAFKESIIQLTRECMRFKSNTIIGVESRGFIFGAPIAFDLDLPLVLARKPGKLPNATVSKSYTLEYGEAELHIQEISPIMGKIVIIDDLIATGGTMMAGMKLLEKLGAEVIEGAAIVDLPELGGSQKLLAAGLPLFTLVNFEGH